MAFSNIIILSGAGISQESGIKTFRDANGLWQNHDIMTVASPEGWQKNPDLVLEFYNQRRRQLKEVEPNEAHKAITRLQAHFPVKVITQNVDDLHERAGNKNILHLHGELLKVRSEQNPNLIYHWTDDLYLGDKAEDGAQLRPHIVWFGESVPNLEKAVQWANQADLMIIVGTSMQVYPAAGLVHALKSNVPVVYIDPSPTPINIPNPLTTIAKKAGQGLPELVRKIINDQAF